jgi:hypothetical protein
MERPNPFFDHERKGDQFKFDGLLELISEDDIESLALIWITYYIHFHTSFWIFDLNCRSLSQILLLVQKSSNIILLGVSFT